MVERFDCDSRVIVTLDRFIYIFFCREGGGGGGIILQRPAKVLMLRNKGLTFSILFFRSQEFESGGTDLSQVRASRGQELKRSQSADELSTSHYDMFEQRRASGQDIVHRGGIGRDGYMRMKQTGRESVDVTDGGFQMGTVDVAIGGIGTPRRGSSQLYGTEEHEITFSGDNGGRNVYYLDDGGYRTEEWYARRGRGTGQLRQEGFREIHVEHQPIYTEIKPNSEVSKISF